MLNKVPETINKVSRQVVLRHPNAMPCVVFRKKLLRQSDDDMGGIPTIGGIGVLDGEDEADYEYELLGEAKLLFAATYIPRSGNTTDDGDMIIFGEEPMEGQVESLAEPDKAGYFETKKSDIVQVILSEDIILPYEVVGVTSPGAIPPYTRKLYLQPRADAQRGI